MSDSIHELMEDGTLCSMCGAYIGNSIGYPRECALCTDETYEEDKPDDQE